MGRRAGPVTNLPVERGAFIGRARLLDELGATFAKGARLVTLTGPEGIGKTRLALRVAARELPRFKSGAVLVVDAVDLRDEAALARAVAEVAGLEPGAAASPAEAVARVGRALPALGPLLLLLDGCDVAGDAVGRALSAWLPAAPDARVLATSRRALGVPGEEVVQVGPLKLPRQSATDSSAIVSSEAVELFVERAREARRGYEPARDEVPSLARIVRLLEGVPLAIEIAAARMRALSPSELLERLPRNVGLLVEKKKDGSMSQRSALAGAVAWSLDLLQPWERSALFQCAVFAGGFDADAARAVVDLTSHEDAPSIDVVLESLCEKSLLRVEDARGFPGEKRYSQASVVREFAEKGLAAESALPALEKRHGTHYLAVAGAWAEGVDGHGGLMLRRRLELEAENLLATVRRALAAEPGTLVTVTWALRGLLAVEPVLLMRGPHDVIEELLDRSLEPAEAVGAPFALRARVHELRARVRRLRGRMPGSLEDLQVSLQLARKAKDKVLEGRARANVGTHMLYQGDLDRARAEYDAALALLREAGERRIEGRCLGFCALLDQEQGRPEDAKRRYEEAIRVHRETGDRRYEGIHLGQLGTVYFVLGRLDEARACYKRALSMHREVGNRRAEGIVLGWLGDLAFEQGALDEARLHHGAALATHKAVLDRRSEGLSIGKLAHVLLDQGDGDGARRKLIEALAIHREVGNKRAEGLVLGALAALDASRQDFSIARESLAEARRLLGGVGDPNLAEVLELYEGHVDLCAARAAGLKDAGDAHVERRLAAKSKLGAALQRRGDDATQPDGAPSGMDRSEDVRLALRTIVALRLLSNA